ncbi:hypothetical protein APHAL10511_002306 [Amanita phalloides]|nr:hypothetical protein APHAL10511_002306 [Amanita phalloides]
MSTSHFAFSLFIQVQLLPILFLFHILCLCATALWTGKHMALLIQDITLIEDDVSVPHPPGHLESTKINLHSESVEDGASFDHDACIPDSSLSGGSILFATLDAPFDTPLIVFSAVSDDQYILDDLTIPEADITLLDDMEKAAECVLKEDMFSALYSPDKVYIIDGIEPSDSVTSLDITEQYFGRTSLATRTPPSIHYSEEQELDMTQREETLKPSISISKQDIILPRVPDGTPIFSRYTIDDNVIFPIRKPSSQRNSTSFSEDIKSAFKKVATWAKTKDELSVDHSRSSISPRSSVIGNFSLFKVEEADPTVPERDSYDSWPFIRNRIQKDFAQDVLEDEEESIENIIKSALGYNRLA